MGIASLIAAPAVVRAGALMPIVVWRPTFYKCGGHHGWPYMLAGSEEDLLGFDLSSLGLPAPSRTISVAPKLWIWRYENFPIEKLPRSRVHIPLWQQRELETGRQNAALAAVSTVDPAEKANSKPDDAILFDLLADWAPEEATSNRILVDNPVALYGFS